MIFVPPRDHVVDYFLAPSHVEWLQEREALFDNLLMISDRDTVWIALEDSPPYGCPTAVFSAWMLLRKELGDDIWCCRPVVEKLYPFILETDHATFIVQHTDDTPTRTYAAVSLAPGLEEEPRVDAMALFLSNVVRIWGINLSVRVTRIVPADLVASDGTTPRDIAWWKREEPLLCGAHEQGPWGVAEVHHIPLSLVHALDADLMSRPNLEWDCHVQQLVECFAGPEFAPEVKFFEWHLPPNYEVQYLPIEAFVQEDEGWAGQILRNAIRKSKLKCGRPLSTEELAYERTRIAQNYTGWFWQDTRDGHMFGPYETEKDALDKIRKNTGQGWQ